MHSVSNLPAVPEKFPTFTECVIGSPAELQAIPPVDEVVCPLLSGPFIGHRRFAHARDGRRVPVGGSLREPDMVATILAICIVGVLPLITAGLCALFIATGAAVPANDRTAFTPAPYQPMEILTRARRTV